MTPKDDDAAEGTETAMMRRRLLLWATIVLACGLGGCAAAPRARMERIEAGKDGRGFVGAASGRRFVPWGFNYDRDYRLRLLEDYWEAEWPTVVRDFGEMKALGANIVRVHLQLARFMDGPETTNGPALAQLGRLVALAEQTGVYLDITGLGCYRKQDVPAWYAALDEARRWDVQARFWEGVAARCAGSPAVFCYDLMNEPVVPSGRRGAGEWLAGELAGFSYVQFISLDQAGRARPEIARQWIGKLVSAIRRHDRRRLVSVGLLPDPQGASGFVPREVAKEVDFLCVHLYPDRSKMDEAARTLEAFAVGKPVVVEETFPLQCGADELRRFIEGSRQTAAGWLGFYWGRTPDELRTSREIGDALMLAWLEMFQKARPGN